MLQRVVSEKLTSYFLTCSTNRYVLIDRQFILSVHLAPPLPLRPSDGICANATWIQNAVAGSDGLGSALYRLNAPWGFFVDDNQAVYVADSGNHRVVKWERGVSSGRQRKWK